MKAHTPELYIISKENMDSINIMFVTGMHEKNYFNDNVIRHIIGENINIETLEYPLIAKMHFKSKNNDLTIIENKKELISFINTHDIRKYIFQKYKNFKNEYRFQVTKKGIFCIQKKTSNKTFPTFHPGKPERN